MTDLPFRDLALDAAGKLVLIDLDGVAHVGVTPVRAHPISAPDDGLSLVGVHGHELAWVARLSALPDAPRGLLEAELAAREFHPTLKRLISVNTFATPSTWRVETDRGEVDFVLKSEEDIRRLDEGRLLITSNHGVQMQVPDRWALDKQSKRLLERFL
ncbi:MULTISPECIES: DUF1854 domain-containing protein [unclassified Roseateles]|uniref:cyanophycin metabolism-associated DUF1854 family protein n=1 Tax=unclassified Roseateles TaxID=2626991 RepID=UPI0006FBC1B8|nr:MULTISPECIES: DUF1854 domain-containing protein [unclassified Roseateles]KQW51313.1 hypothetical protein ASC81_01285 [Pelomonas sp. Root405]KRA77545.1 hypothetical protein ASD88_01285 [Pelomonas sp. Root662]